MKVFASRGIGVGRGGRIGVATWVRGAGGALVFGLSLLVLAGCSLGGPTGKAPGGGDLVVDPCEPECCCRAKDNYYVRYGCSTRVRCMQDGGECTTDNVDKCQSDDDTTSNTDAIKREVPLALISAARTPSLFGRD